MNKGLFISLLFSAVSVCSAQTGIVKLAPDLASQAMLKQAGNSYNNGSFLECIDNIEKILALYDLKKFDKVHALELAAKASVETGEMGKADTYVNLMLKLFPHYDLKEEENPESFNRLVKKYKIHPALSVGVRNTADWMNYNTMKVFSFNGIENSAPYHKELEGILHGFGFMYYGWGEIEFDRGYSFNAEFIFKWTNFTRNMAVAPPYDLTFREQDNYFELPIYFKKYFNLSKNVMTYAAGGFGWIYMLQANGSAYIYYPSADSSSGTGEINMMPYRNKSTFEWIAGTGIGYKYRNLRMFFDARYYCGLNSITDPEKSAGNTTLVNDYFYIDNSIRLTQFELGVSISYTLFNSVKRTKHQTP